VWCACACAWCACACVRRRVCVRVRRVRVRRAARLTFNTSSPARPPFWKIREVMRWLRQRAREERRRNIYERQLAGGAASMREICHLRERDVRRVAAQHDNMRREAAREKMEKLVNGA